MASTDTLVNHIVPVYVDGLGAGNGSTCYGWMWEETFCGSPVHPHQGDCAPSLDAPYCANLWVHDGPCQYLTSDPEEEA